MYVIYFIGIGKVFFFCCDFRIVYLRRCVNFIDDVVIVLIEYCSYLEYFNLCGCVEIIDVLF